MGGWAAKFERGTAAQVACKQRWPHLVMRKLCTLHSLCEHVRCFPHTHSSQTRTFRLEGLVMRSQIELLLREQAYCDAHGRYLRPPPTVGGDVDAYEDALAAAMTHRLEHRPSGGPLLGLGGGGGSGSGADLLEGLRGSGGPAEFERRPSPFDNQVGSRVTPG